MTHPNLVALSLACEAERLRDELQKLGGYADEVAETDEIVRQLRDLAANIEFVTEMARRESLNA